MKQFLIWKISDTVRLFSFLKEKLHNCYTNTDISSMIRNQRCLVNKKVERFESTMLHPGNEVVVFPKCFPEITYEEKNVLLETPYYLIYDKPAYISSEQLAKKLKLQLVHRLDKDTTGCILFSKSASRNQKLENLFRKRKIVKKYLAFVNKTPAHAQGTIKSFLSIKKRRAGAITMFSSPFSENGKLAVTRWKCLKKTSFGSLLLCEPLTGRTHQIRVHLQSLGHSILGDIEYGSSYNKKFFSFRCLLHAQSISFECPYTYEKKYVHSEMLSETIYYFSSDQKIFFSILS